MGAVACCPDEVHTNLAGYAPDVFSGQPEICLYAEVFDHQRRVTVESVHFTQQGTVVKVAKARTYLIEVGRQFGRE